MSNPMSNPVRTRSNPVSDSHGLPWTPADIPDLTGRRALVTGVTSGIGEQTAMELARHGSEVILGARNAEKLAASIARISHEVPGAVLHPLTIDVSDLESVRRAAALAAEHGPLHLLVNNAGVMATPYQRTPDGLELQMATNHFGPFALTGLLLPQLAASGDARVVAISSQASRLTRTPPLDDPRDLGRRYRRWEAYSKSKLANVMFALELDCRAREHGVPVKGMAAHPGFSATGLMAARDPGSRQRMRLTATVLQAAFEALGQPSSLGALPTLMAATADLPGATYVGPGGPLQMRGHPRVVSPRRLARDEQTRKRLWRLSEDATGVRFLGR